jgi:hypothetical protein
VWIAWALLVVAVVAAMLAVSGLALHDPWSIARSRGIAELGRLPRSDIARAPGETLVRIVGRVRTFGEPLAAPPDDARCIGYQVIVEDLQRHAGGLVAEATWVAVEAEFDVGDFWIEDDTGVALVRCTDARGGADLRLRRDRFGVVAELGDRRHVRVTIGDGDRVAVCGYATWDHDDGTPPVIDLPEVIGRRLVLRSQPRQPIVIDEPALMASQA